MTVASAPRRHVEPEMVELPYGIRIALKRLANELLDMPRECAVDRHEMILWKNRIARRLLGLERTKVPAERPTWNTPKLAPCRAALPATISAHDAAEAAFGKTAQPATTARVRSKPRTITSRKGKQVRVETRSSGQLALFEVQR